MERTAHGPLIASPIFSPLPISEPEELLRAWLTDGVFITANGCLDDHVEGMSVAGSCIHPTSRMSFGWAKLLLVRALRVAAQASHLHRSTQPWLGMQRRKRTTDPNLEGETPRVFLVHIAAWHGISLPPLQRIGLSFLSFPFLGSGGALYPLRCTNDRHVHAPRRFPLPMAEMCGDGWAIVGDCSGRCFNPWHSMGFPWSFSFWGPAACVVGPLCLRREGTVRAWWARRCRSDAGMGRGRRNGLRGIDESVVC